jgi:predicted ATPase
MLGEKVEVMVESISEKKAYQTPVLITHGSVAKLTQHDSGGHSGLDCVPMGTHHRHRWWESLF